MKISYNWLKWYIPEVPEAEKLSDIFTFHICEVDSLDKLPDGDYVFDLKVLPDRAHDLLSHLGVARELSSLLGISFNDPTAQYKIPEATATNLQIKLETDKCRRYTARIVRNVSVGASPEWVVKHLESIGQRSINNVVDAANLVMYDCGQPIHAFDLDKVTGSIVVRLAKAGEEITTLDNKQVKLIEADMVIADDAHVLAIAGVKGGKVAEVDINTKNIIIEVANFDGTTVRKTRRNINIFTDAAKRFENDLSPELCDYAMREMSGLLLEYFAEGPEGPKGAEWEETIDVYPNKQTPRTLAFRLSKMSSMLGYELTPDEAEQVLNRYHFKFTKDGDKYEIDVPAMRLDLNIEEDMVEEFGRVLGYDRVAPKLPEMDFKPEIDEIYTKINIARAKLLEDGYSEVMTYAFCDKGEVEVLASASDKKFLRTNLKDGLVESVKLNVLNSPLLGIADIKVFEIGKVFFKDHEEWHVAYGGKKEIKEVTLDEFTSPEQENFVVPPASGFPHEQNLSAPAEYFKMWSLYPFIVRDIALWVPNAVSSSDVENIIKEHVNELVVKGPVLFDKFTKGEKTSYAFRLVFQSFERTLTDEEVAGVMEKINTALKAHADWELR
ncbi:MAG TPA: phenylalanine--tRNA ligase subunit beta [Candidatus Paceibacterota bacterium]